ncbi:hypothetical protein EDB86DRAFT_2942678 [Lactarius hatsudake]|nr:hypothetical protein EDB86DRAFT_2942678 [Lactarius hatsudake]
MARRRRWYVRCWPGGGLFFFFWFVCGGGVDDIFVIVCWQVHVGLATMWWHLGVLVVCYGERTGWQWGRQCSFLECRLEA